MIFSQNWIRFDFSPSVLCTLGHKNNINKALIIHYLLSRTEYQTTTQ